MEICLIIISIARLRCDCKRKMGGFPGRRRTCLPEGFRSTAGTGVSPAGDILSLRGERMQRHAKGKPVFNDGFPFGNHSCATKGAASACGARKNYRAYADPRFFRPLRLVHLALSTTGGVRFTPPLDPHPPVRMRLEVWAGGLPPANSVGRGDSGAPKPPTFWGEVARRSRD